MEKAGVAKKLDEPMWVDKEGNQCAESKAHGKKASHELTRLDMVIFIDKVSGDTSQEVTRGGKQIRGSS